MVRRQRRTAAGVLSGAKLGVDAPAASDALLRRSLTIGSAARLRRQAAISVNATRTTIALPDPLANPECEVPRALLADPVSLGIVVRMRKT